MFDLKKLVTLGGQGKRGEAFQTFGYVTTDSISTMLSTGYWNSLKSKASVNDSIFVQDINTSTFYNLRITSIDISGIVSVEELSVDFGVQDYIDFNTAISNPNYLEGRLFYDQDKQALSYYNNVEDITVNMGQELLFRVENQSGEDLPNGTIIYPDPTTIIGKADAYVKSKSRLIAMVTSTIKDGETGYATRLGQVGRINTSMYTAGQTLYLDTDGGYSTTAPIDGGYAIIIGVVDVVDTSEGIITFDPHLTELTVEVTDTNGFPPDQRENTIIVPLESTRLFSILPVSPETDFHYYEVSEKYESTGDAITWADEEGEHWFFYEGGTLKTEYNPSLPRKEHIILNHAFVATLYWNATDKKIEIDVIDERHGISMSPQTHLYLHETRGAKHLYGFQLGNIVSNASGDDNVDAQYSISAGQFADEDIRHTSTAVAVGDTIPVIYNLGANADLRSDSQTGFALLNAPAGRLYFNEFTGGAWQLSEVTNNDFVLYHDFAINGQDVINIRVMGQNEYGTRNQARNGANQEIANLIAQLPFVEMIPVATTIYQTSNGYDNDVKARIISTGEGDYISWIDTEISQGSAPSSHLNLTDVQKAGVDVDQGHIDNLDQTIDGIKTFLDSPLVPTPTTDTQVANKKYVDDNAGVPALPYNYINGGLCEPVFDASLQYDLIGAPSYDDTGYFYTLNGTTQNLDCSPRLNSATILLREFYIELEFDSLTGQLGIAGTYSDAIEGLAWQFNGTTNQMQIYMSSTGGSWDIANALLGTKTDWSTGTKYQLKLWKDTSDWKLDWSSDGKKYNDPTKTWTNDLTIVSTAELYTSPTIINIGASYHGTNRFLPGKIYLENTAIVSSNKGTTLLAQNGELGDINVSALDCRGYLDLINISEVASVVSSVSDFVTYDSESSLSAEDYYDVIEIIHTDSFQQYIVINDKAIEKTDEDFYKLKSDAITAIESFTARTIQDYRYVGCFETDASSKIIPKSIDKEGVYSYYDYITDVSTANYFGYHTLTVPPKRLANISALTEPSASANYVTILNIRGFASIRGRRVFNTGVAIGQQKGFVELNEYSEIEVITTILTSMTFICYTNGYKETRK